MAGKQSLLYVVCVADSFDIAYQAQYFMHQAVMVDVVLSSAAAFARLTRAYLKHTLSLITCAQLHCGSVGLLMSFT